MTSLYDSFFAEAYDHIPLYANRGDLDFYLAEARRAAQAAAPGVTPVLELGCGSGRILVPTARAGIGVTGLDLSRAMLERCRMRLGSEAPEVRERVRLLEGSMTSFDFDAAFQLITTPFRSFQHLLTVEDQLRCLRAAHRHLAPGGRLILDLFHPNPAALSDPQWQEEKEDTPATRLPDGTVFRRTSRIAGFHRDLQQNECEFRFYLAHPGGREEVITEGFTLRYFFRYEVEHLLARSGFRAAALYGDFARSPFAHDSAEMIFIAEKGD
jgi:SAM-dependent methyltransferase